MTKKSKLILGWSIPTLTVAVASSVALTTIILLDSKKREILNSSKNYPLIPFNQMSQEAQKNLIFNPKDYDFDFFWQNICQTSLVNSVFEFKDQGFKYDKTENVWKSPQGVAYSIDSIVNNGSNTDNYNFVVKVKKTYNGVSSIPYTQTITIPKASFATPENSKQNFASHSAKIINNLFLNNNLQVISTKEVAANISDFNSPSDVNIKTNNFVNNSQINSQLAASFFKDDNNLYITNNEAFKYNLDVHSSFSIPLSGNIWSSSEYKIDSKGIIADDSQIYSFLSSQYLTGNLTYLPELNESTYNEKLESKESNNNDNSEITPEIKKRIQKLIFDPAYIPFEYKNNQKVPLNNLQAIAIKVQLDDKFTWLITWTNLLSISPNLVLNANELEMVPTLKNNQELTYEEIQNPLNYIYFEPTTQPSNGLIYEVVNVSFAPEDTYKMNANLTIKVSHPEIETTKEYTISISKGFQSKAYVDLYNQINAATNNFTNLDSIKPTITSKNNASKKDFLENYTNKNWLQENLNFVSPGALTNAVYSINWATLSNDSSKILFSFSIASTNDPNNLIRYNLAVQEIFGEFTIPTAIIKINEQNNNYLKNNETVFLDS